MLSGLAALTRVEQVRVIADTRGLPVRFEEVPVDELRFDLRIEGWVVSDIEGMMVAYTAMAEAEQPIWDTVERFTGDAPKGLVPGRG